MSSILKRTLVVGIAASVALLGFVPPAPATAAVPLPLAKKATPVEKTAAWLKAHPAEASDGYGLQVQSTLALITLDAKGTAGTVRSRVADLASEAGAKTAASVGAAANLVVLLKAMHLDPRSFGGTDVVANLKAGIDPDTGQVGSFPGAYSQALGIIALKRAKEPVPAKMVDLLLTFQATTGPDSGAFGYEWGGFVADPDSTALAIQALDLVGGHKTPIRNAVKWAKDHQTKLGYWDSYSPVDSTSLLGSALSQVKQKNPKALSWLKSQQLGNGSFPAALGDTNPNLFSTSNAAFLLSGKSFAKVTYSPKKFSKSPKPKVNGIRKVGQTLKVSVGKWSPKPEFSYQWYRSGKKVGGATGSSYLLVKADQGKKIRVKVTATGIGLKTKSVKSKYTGQIKKA